MILVIDASVAVKWFVEEDHSSEAWTLLEAKHHIVAPDLLVAEVANVAWKKTIRGEINPVQARTILRNIALPAFISEFIEVVVLGERALSMAMQWKHPIYDCFYAACAEALAAPLVSADGKLLDLLKAHRSSIRAVALAQAGNLTGG
jgi:predicted nucleic acid-binding protein